MSERDDAEIRGLRNIAAETQRSLNEQLMQMLEARHVFGIVPRPLTRWEKRKRRISNRWYDARRRVALWIAPELDDY